MAESDK
jgi:hypothetical protein